MKNIHLGFITFLLSVQVGMAQANTIGTTGKWGSQIFLSDVNGRAFENKYDGIVGSPYLLPDYKYATIYLNNGKQFDNVKAKINLEAHEIVFMDSKGQEGYIGKGLVRTIIIIDTTSTGINRYIFASGYPKMDNQTNLSFYQLLKPGGIVELFKYINKTIEERGNELSGEKSKEFITRETLYIRENGVMQRVKKDKAFFATIFAKYPKEFNNYVLANKVNFKNEEDLKKLLTYYDNFFKIEY
jgi:hypothetical protein